MPSVMNFLLHDGSDALHEPNGSSDHRDYARDSGETGEDFGALASVQFIASPRIQTSNDYKQANN